MADARDTATGQVWNYAAVANRFARTLTPVAAGASSGDTGVFFRLSDGTSQCAGVFLHATSNSGYAPVLVQTTGIADVEAGEVIGSGDVIVSNSEGKAVKQSTSPNNPVCGVAWDRQDTVGRPVKVLLLPNRTGPLPDRLAANATESVNADTILSSGWYWLSDGASGLPTVTPTPLQWSLECVWSSFRAYQIAYAGNNSNDRPRSFIRYYNGDGPYWTAWREHVSLTVFSPTDDNVLQRKSGDWAQRTPTQFLTDLNWGITTRSITSNITTLSGTTVEQHCGTFVIPAAKLTTGDTIHLHVEGYATQTAVAHTLTARVRVGASGGVLSGVVPATAVLSQAAAKTTVPFSIDAWVTVRSTGASGTCIGGVAINGPYTYDGSSTSPAITSTVTIDTTSIKDIAITLQASAVTITGGVITTSNISRP